MHLKHIFLEANQSNSLSEEFCGLGSSVKNGVSTRFRWFPGDRHMGTSDALGFHHVCSGAKSHAVLALPPRSVIADDMDLDGL